MRNNQFSVETHKVAPFYRGVVDVKISPFSTLTLCVQQFHKLILGICTH